jgi:hypothetical protein
MRKPLTQAERDIARKFKRMMRARSRGKLFFEEAEKAGDELLKELTDPTKPFRLVRSGKKLGRFKDNYAASNVCFRAHGIKRFEPEVIEKAE